ncbi:MAG: hypothetical protein AMS18_00285 [Gemmatimonas sp. SG8_17]|nr:MAG: hypothetical protein AMS18_00285 [Gemmatimonas sp. SG8_17]
MDPFDGLPDIEMPWDLQKVDDNLWVGQRVMIYRNPDGQYLVRIEASKVTFDLLVSLLALVSSDSSNDDLFNVYAELSEHFDDEADIASLLNGAIVLDEEAFWDGNEG